MRTFGMQLKKDFRRPLEFQKVFEFNIRRQKQFFFFNLKEILSGFVDFNRMLNFFRKIVKSLDVWKFICDMNSNGIFFNHL